MTKFQEDTFTFEELRVSMTAFAVWLLQGGPGEGRAAELVDKFIEETT